MKVCEEKMLICMPIKEKKKYLALNTSASPKEIAEAEEDLANWLKSTSLIDEKLKFGNYEEKSNNDSKTRSPLSLLNKSQSQKIQEAKNLLKYDDLSPFQREHRAGEFFFVIFFAFILLLSIIIIIIIIFLLELERRKGNESFKSTEYDDAIKYYTNSIALHDETDAIWANRAIAYIKKQAYDLAEVDCNIALFINSKNTKALARRGFARFSQGKYKQVRKFLVNLLLFHSLISY
jgi:tetratricopeptide (TPR) repeat protein